MKTRGAVGRMEFLDEHVAGAHVADTHVADEALDVVVDDPFDLRQRFVRKQAQVYARALSEIRAGSKDRCVQVVEL